MWGCAVPPKKLFDFKQSELIDANKSTLDKYGDGVCLALTMLWCKHKKEKLVDSIYPTRASVSTLMIAQWMNTVQDVPLQNLFGNFANPVLDALGRPQNTFPFANVGGTDPETSVDTAKGKINNLVAYAHRLEKMSQWARKSDLSLLDDRVGFPSGSTFKQWTTEVTNVACAPSSQPVYGLIALTGEDEGHAMGIRYTENAFYPVEFFDPNEGAWGFRETEDFQPWLSDYFETDYADLNHLGWVLMFLSAPPPATSGPRR
jgi:hypothetical protein